MKITVWHPPHESAEIKFADTEKVGIQKELIIGYIDLPIEKPKKTVVKEAKMIGGGEGFVSAMFALEPKSKNPKCTYEIDE